MTSNERVKRPGAHVLEEGVDLCARHRSRHPHGLCGWRAVEGERAEAIRRDPTPAVELLRLRGIGVNSAWLHVMEFFGWRQFRNRREVGGLTGLTPTPYHSGEVSRERRPLVALGFCAALTGACGDSADPVERAISAEHAALIMREVGRAAIDGFNGAFPGPGSPSAFGRCRSCWVIGTYPRRWCTRTC